MNRLPLKTVPSPATIAALAMAGTLSGPIAAQSTNPEAASCHPTDHFADRCQLNELHHAGTANNESASSESEERQHLGMTAGNSLWIEWKSPRAVQLEIVTSGTGTPPEVYIFTGFALTSLQAVAQTKSTATEDGEAELQFKAIVESDTVYQIVFTSSSETSGSFDWSLSARPVNDDFANRTRIHVDDQTIHQGHNELATEELEEPSHNTADVAAASGQNTVWWTFTAPENSRTLSIEVLDHLFSSRRPPQLAVYQGSDYPEGLTRVASNFSGSKTPFAFHVVPGTDYHLAVDSLKPFGLDPPFSVPHQYGTFDFRVRSGRLVPHDSFESPLVATLGTPSEYLSAMDATPNREGEPAIQASTSGSSLWWTFKPPSPRSAEHCFTITAEGRQSDGPDFAPLIGLFTGAVNSKSVAHATAEGIHTFCDNPAVSAYHILLDGYPWINPEAYRLTIATAVPPTNDNLSDALEVSDEVTLSGNNLTATVESEEPSHSSFDAGRSIWWQWTTSDTTNVEVRADRSGESSQLLLSVHSRNPDGTFRTVTENSPIPDPAVAGDYPNMAPILTFRAEPDRPYLIRAASVGSPTVDSSSIELILTKVSESTNDQAQNAIQLTNNQITGNNQGATREEGEPAIGNATANHSLWWQWQAPTHGTVTLTETSLPGGFRARLGVFQWSEPDLPISSLQSIAQSGDPDRGYRDAMVFTVTEGQSYLLAVDSRNGTTGPFELMLDFVPGYRMIAPVVVGDTLHFQVEGNPSFVGRDFVIEHSTNASDWTRIEPTYRLDPDRLEIELPLAPGLEHGFFRAISSDNQ